MKEATGTHEILTRSEAAVFIRVSEKTLGEMARTGRIPAQKAGREWRFLRGALEAWLLGVIADERILFHPTGRLSPNRRCSMRSRSRDFAIRHFPKITTVPPPLGAVDRRVLRFVRCWGA